MEYLIKNMGFLDELFEEDPELSVLFKALSRIIKASEGRMVELHEKTLVELSKGMFEKCIITATIAPAGSAKEIACINLHEFEKWHLSGELNLYRWIAEALVNSLSGGKDSDMLAEIWLLSFNEVTANLPLSLKMAIATSVKTEIQSYYARMLRGLPQSASIEYRKKLNDAGPEEVVQIFRCPQCNILGVKVENIFDLLGKRQVKCEKCGHEIPLKLSFEEEFLGMFAKWARTNFIPQHLMPMLIKLQESMSLITCNVLVYRNMVVRGTTSTIKGVIMPTHPEQEVTLTLVDPKGVTKTFNAQTDASGEYVFEYRFEECGEWRIHASWRGDEDHFGAFSKEITVLVLEL